MSILVLTVLTKWKPDKQESCWPVDRFAASDDKTQKIMNLDSGGQQSGNQAIMNHAGQLIDMPLLMKHTQKL